MKNNMLFRSLVRFAVYISIFLSLELIAAATGWYRFSAFCLMAGMIIGFTDRLLSEG